MLLYALQRTGLAILICITSMVMLFSALKLIPGFDTGGEVLVEITKKA